MNYGSLEIELKRVESENLEEIVERDPVDETAGEVVLLRTGIVLISSNQCYWVTNSLIIINHARSIVKRDSFGTGVFVASTASFFLF